MKNLLKNFIQNQLKFLASHLFKKFHPKVIAVTGSIGKTSTKEAIFMILKNKYRGEVASNPGNLNSEFGMPLAILGFKNQPSKIGWLWILPIAYVRSFITAKLPQYLILEMAADKPGDIKYLTSVATPQIAVLTSIGPTHLEKFHTIEAVAEEKFNLIKALPENGIAVLNGDDPNIQKLIPGVKVKKILFFAKPLEIATKAAIAAAQALDIPQEESKKILRFFEMPEGRLNTLAGINGSVIIDDSYNANPLSMKAALEKLASSTGKRKIALLGDMRELGEGSLNFHKQIARLAREKADLFITVGPYFRQCQSDHWFATTGEIKDWLLKEIKEGDIILIKASHGIELYKIVNDLRK